jgi:hypothetical protein
MLRTLFVLIPCALACVSIFHDPGFHADWFVNPEEFLTAHPTVSEVPVPAGGRVLFVPSSFGAPTYIASIALTIPSNESSLIIGTTVISNKAKVFRYTLELDGEQERMSLGQSQGDSLTQVNWTLNHSVHGVQHLVLSVSPIWLDGYWLAITDVQVWSCAEPGNLDWLWALGLTGGSLAFVITLIVLFYRRSAQRYSDLPLDEIQVGTNG